MPPGRLPLRGSGDGSNRGGRPDLAAHDDDAGYWSLARRPLNILVFLLPLVIAYELCLVLVLRARDGGSVTTVLAHKRLLEVFESFGFADAGGLYLGGLVLVVVLLAWHVLTGDRWRVDWATIGGMGLESMALALPLLALGLVLARRITAAAATGAGIETLDVWSKMAISVGAGLYEELVFRMVLIAVIHTLLVDLAGLKHWVGSFIAITISALAFTFYHDLRNATGDIEPSRVVFYLLAGLYFGAVYSLRGFGIVVGAHAVYDVIAVLRWA